MLAVSALLSCLLARPFNRAVDNTMETLSLAMLCAITAAMSARATPTAVLIVFVYVPLVSLVAAMVQARVARHRAVRHKSSVADVAMLQLTNGALAPVSPVQLQLAPIQTP